MPARGNIYIEATPEPALVAQAYFAAAEKLRDMSDPLEAAAAIGTDEVKMNFNEQGRPTHWEPLSQETINRRVFASLSGSQKEALFEMKADSKFEGTLTPGPGGSMQFIPSATTNFAQVFGGLASSMLILIDTGTLMDGVTAGTNWNYRRLSGNSQGMEMTDPTGYGSYHITGTTHIPVRDWSYISDEAVDNMSTIFAEWLST
jgi:hypothetical protein